MRRKIETKPKTELETDIIVVVPPELQAFKAYVLNKMDGNLSLYHGALLKRVMDEYISLYCR